MKITIKAFLPDAGYFAELEEKPHCEIEFSRADSNNDDIEVKVDGKRYWISREDMKKILVALTA